MKNKLMILGASISLASCSTPNTVDNSAIPKDKKAKGNNLKVPLYRWVTVKKFRCKSGYTIILSRPENLTNANGSHRKIWVETPSGNLDSVFTQWGYSYDSKSVDELVNIYNALNHPTAQDYSNLCPYTYADPSTGTGRFGRLERIRLGKMNKKITPNLAPLQSKAKR